MQMGICRNKSKFRDYHVAGSQVLKSVIFGCILFFTVFSGRANAVSIFLPSDCDTVTVVNSFTINFLGVTYDTEANTSKWDYTLYWDGTPPALSHFIIELCPTITAANIVAVEPSYGNIGYGPTGLYGIKWDDIENFPADTQIFFSFTLDEMYEVKSVQEAPKAGLDLNVVDICGPSVVCELIVNCDIIISCPDDILVPCDGSIDPTFTGYPTYTKSGICPDLILTYTDAPAYDTLLSATVIIRNWIVTDSEAVVYDNCFQKIILEDSIPPVFDIACPTDTTVECSEIPTAPTLTATDNCDSNPVVILEEYITDSVCAGNYTLHRKWTATDASGNSDSCLQTITVIDTTPPDFDPTCPADLTLDCSDSIPEAAVLTATDNCDLAPILKFVETTVEGDCPNEKRIIRTWIAKDDCGNESVCTQIINIIDITAPVISYCPPDTTYSSLSEVPACDVSQITASDNCSVVDIVCKRTDLGGTGCSLDPYIFVDSFTVSDSCGNISYCVRTITVIENQTANIDDQYFSYSSCDFVALRELQVIVNNSSTDQYFSLLSGIATIDSLSGLLSYVPDSSGIYQFVVTLTTPCGVDTATMTDTLSFNRPPVISCPGPQTFYACQLDTFCFEVSAIDKDNDQLTYSIISGNATISGNTVCVTGFDFADFDVIIKVTDSCGSYDTCIVPVSIIPNSAPFISLADDFTISLCQPETICFAASIFDSENNIEEVTVSLGYYEEASNRICVDIDTAGVYSVVVTATDSCGEISIDSVRITVDVNQKPFVDLGSDLFYNFCSFEEICFDVTVTDDNLIYVSSTVGAYYSQTGQLCFLPDTAGTYTIIVEAGDKCQLKAVDTILVTVTGGVDSYVNLGNDTTVAFCELTEICFDVESSDSASLTTNLGYIDPNTGQVCFTPQAAGNYLIIVSLTDTCGTSSADSLVLSVELRTAPELYGLQDSLVYFCFPQYICLDFTLIDPDNDLTSVSSNYGYVNLKTNQVCFYPTDSGQYEIIVTAIDSCGNLAADTAIVTVRTDQGLFLEAGNDTTIFACELDTLCFPVRGMPDDAVITVTGINTWYDAENKTVCFFNDCSITNKITVTGTTECGTYTDEFTVVTICNSAPLVILPPDSLIFLCDTQTVCLPVGISDIDNNIETIVADGATYSDIFSSLCFKADTSGVYIINVTVTDSCGAVDSDQIVVTVEIGDAPVCNLPSDTTITGCETGQVSLPVSALGNIDSCVIISGAGEIVNGNWIYTPSGNETVTITIRCYDQCGGFCEGTFTVNFDMNTPPVCSADIDSLIFFCQPEEICIPLSAVDAQDSLLTIELVSGLGTIVDGIYCVTPVDGLDSIYAVIRFTDQCGAFCEQIINLKFDNNTAPEVFCTIDTTYLICNSEDTLCIGGFGVTDSENNLVSFKINGVEYNGNYHCFVPVEGNNQLVAIAIDECGAADTCITNITVKFNSAPVCNVPNDTTIISCTSDTVFLPVFSTDAEFNNYAPCQIIDGPGQIIDDNWVYLPTGVETVTVTIRCTDACGLVCEDSFTVNFEINSPPLCPADIDSLVSLCVIEEICIPIGATDLNDSNLTVEIISGPGAIVNGSFCYTPIGNDSLVTIIRYTDDCGIYCEQIIKLNIEINTPPEVICPADTSILVCAPGDTVCISGFGSVSNSNVSITSLGGELKPLGSGNFEICFVPQAGNNEIGLIIQDDCGNIDTCLTNVFVTFNSAPVCDLIEDILVNQCAPQEICVPLKVTDIDNNLISYEVIKGPGTIVDSSWCYTPVASGVDTVIIRFTDDCGEFCETLFVLDFELNQAPIAIDTTYSFEFCFGGEERLLNVIAADFENDFLTYSLLSGAGVIDSISGTIAYTPDTAGTYLFSVVISDSCRQDTALISDIITFNERPIGRAYDTTIVLCAPQEICITYEATDPEADFVGFTNYEFKFDSLITSQIASNGKIVTCFIPVNVDSAVYQLYFCPLDSCLLLNPDQISNCIPDTINVTVLINVKPEIVCFDSLTFISCSINPPDTFCFDIEIIDPGDLNHTINILSGNAQLINNQVCVIQDVSGSVDVVVEVVDACGLADTCTINLDIKIIGGTSSRVQTANDTTLFLCEPAEICIDAFVEYNSEDLINISTNFGIYDSLLNRVCFFADTSGVYEIIVSADNLCSLSVADTSIVTVFINEKPIVEIADKEVTLCVDSLICVGFTYSDADNNIASVTTNIGYIDTLTGELCFFPDGEGEYLLEITVTDSCGAFTVDTSVVTVKGHSGQAIDLGADQNLLLCDVTEICIDLNNSSALDSITTSIGQFNSETNQICFTPDTSGIYLMIVEAIDSCSFASSDTLTIEININDAPVVTAGDDATFYICYPKYLCVPVDIFDADNNIASITTSYGYYSDGNICFLPNDSGTYQIIITAIDSCGLVSKDTVEVTVKTDQGLVIDLPNDTTVFQCIIDTLCFPVSGIPDNAVVTVSGINVWYDAANKQVCTYTPCAITNNITVTATTDCGEYSDSFRLVVQCNTKPLVILPPDETIIFCDTIQYCLPVGINDIDGNLATITVENGSYDPLFGTICLSIDSAGIYKVTVTATDSCGAVDADEIIITVTENSAPEISLNPADTLFRHCPNLGFDTVCVSVPVSDIDNNLISVSSSLGEYDWFNSTICFLPDSIGLYCLEIIATDDCQAKDTAYICIRVEAGDMATVECVDSSLTLCQAETVCLPLTVSGVYDSITVSMGTFENNQLCFLADTSGLYEIMTVVYSECNIDSCLTTVNINILENVSLTCPENLSLFLCYPDTIAFDFTVSGDYDSIYVSAPAYLSGGKILVPVEAEGTQTITVVADGACSVDSCSFTVTADFNAPPIVTLGSDTSITDCALTELCFPFEISDEDGNFMSVTSSVGIIVGSTVCFTPDSIGQHFIILTATDSCGATSKDTLIVTVQLGGFATIICPTGDQFASICGPDSICIVAPIAPSNINVTVLPNGSYNKETGEICIYVDSAGTIPIKIIAESDCAADTCEFNLIVDLLNAPVIVCPQNIDTLICLSQTDSICVQLPVLGSNVDITVSPAGIYAGGFICVPIDSAGLYEIEIIASSSCGADTCNFSINVTADSPPTLVVPADTIIFRCPRDTGLICISDITASDFESGLSVTQVCGYGELNVDSLNNGTLCFYPDSMGRYEFCLEATDSCSVVSKSFFVTVVEKADCDVCFTVSINSGLCTPVGVNKDVEIVLESNEFIGGFDFLINYDVSVMSFQYAITDGGVIEEWEYFTYRLNSAACGNVCPPGLVRLTAIADINNGDTHPPLESLKPNGTIITIRFLVANDQNLGDQYLPINFIWFACSDNIIGGLSGETYLDNKIFGPEGNLIWDETDDITYPDSIRTAVHGADDDCLVGGDLSTPIRCINFINGGICVIHPDTIDDRGDINLNEIPYEIADAVLYSNYFIRGLSVFTINAPGQVAASDVNADGLTLTIADLVLLIRIIIGDSDPVSKLVPYEEELIISTEITDNRAKVSTEAVSDVGAMLLVYNIEGDLRVGEPQLGAGSSEMILKYSQINNQLRILIFDYGTKKIRSGLQQILEIPLDGEGSLNLISSEIVDYYSRPYLTVSKDSQLPKEFKLSQNYPNPFNPETVIEFSLAKPSEWTLEIYNITGALVRRFDGNHSAGVISLRWDGRSDSGSKVASGIYLYRLVAENFSATKKMLLLK